MFAPSQGPNFGTSCSGLVEKSARYLKNVFSCKKAELYHRRNAELDDVMDASKIPIEAWNVLQWTSLFSVEALQAMFDLVMYIFSGEEVLK